MSYKDRFGSTPIRTGRIDNMTIHWDYDDDPEDKSQRRVILFYTPDMEHNKDNPDRCPEHSHIEIDREQAVIMRDWLVAYCDDIKS